MEYIPAWKSGLHPRLGKSLTVNFKYLRHNVSNGGMSFRQYVPDAGVNVDDQDIIFARPPGALPLCLHSSIVVSAEYRINRTEQSAGTE
jgi:hypothetical protein